MRLWLSRSSEVPLREQLTTQIILGIVSADLKPGQRLPSTRELARRFHIHSNTVSAAYRDLTREGWVEHRRGSGIYVRPLAPGAPFDAKLELDGLISAFLQLARSKGFPLSEVQSRIKHWLSLQPPDHFLIIEPNPELRRILMTEISEATSFPVSGGGYDACADGARLAGAAPVALYNHAEAVKAILPPDWNCLLLHSRSVPESLRGESPIQAEALVSVVSCWTDFLQWARTILIAAGADPASLSFRDARQRGWERGLRSSALIITDTVTAKHLPAGCRPRVFRIIADSSLAELRNFRDFLTRPAAAPAAQKMGP
jgi:GntR family transcriptional regulator